MKTLLIIFLLIKTAAAEQNATTYMVTFDKLFPKECLKHAGKLCSDVNRAIAEEVCKKDPKTKFTFLTRINKSLNDVFPKGSEPLFYNSEWAQQASEEDKLKFNSLNHYDQSDVNIRSRAWQSINRVSELLSCIRKESNDNPDLDEVFMDCTHQNTYSKRLDISQKMRKDRRPYYKVIKETGRYLGFYKPVKKPFLARSVYEKMFKHDCRNDLEKVSLQILQVAHQTSGILEFLKKEKPKVVLPPENSLIHISEMTPDSQWVIGQFRFMLIKFPEFVKHEFTNYDINLEMLSKKVLDWHVKKEKIPAITHFEYAEILSYFLREYTETTRYDENALYNLTKGRCIPGKNGETRGSRQDCLLNSLDDIQADINRAAMIIHLTTFINDKCGSDETMKLNYIVPNIDLR